MPKILFLIMSFLSITAFGQFDERIDAVKARMNKLRLPNIEFDNTPLVEVIREIKRLAQASDPNKAEMNIFLKITDQTAGTSVSMALDNPTLDEVLAAVAKRTNMRVIVGPVGVSLVPDKL